MKKMLYWACRILSILFIAFISMFALDVFGEQQWLVALVMHLIPSFMLIILTAIAWKHERIGGYIFITLGLLLLISSRFESTIIAIPIIVLGVLYLIPSFFRL